MSSRTPSTTSPSHSPSDAIASSHPSRISLFTTILSILLAVSIITGAILGYQPMVDHLRATSTTKPTIRIHWPSMPDHIVRRARAAGHTRQITWMDSKTQHDLNKMLAEILSGDPFDTASLQNAQTALMSTGWFAAPPRLVRHEKGLVEVTAIWRVPFAVVRVDEKDLAVTRDGVLLMPEYNADQSGMPVIFSPKIAPPTLGEEWLGGDVQAGLALIDFLRSTPGFRQIKGIDVNEFQDKKNLVIITNTDTRIVWGGHPKEFNPGQAPPELKRARLAELHAQFGRIDASRPLIDIRTEDGAYIVADDDSLPSAQAHAGAIVQP